VHQQGSWAGGTLLGDTYLLGQRINGGGMGEVFEATHARLPGRYAVKILRPELVGNREAFGRFCREAEVMSELRHPNVVQIYDFNTTPDGRPYFVMEHLEGRDLEARLTQAGPMPLPAAVRVVESVASALAAAHAHGIVHRDLKPANIFLVTIDGQMDEVVKVLDFGISKVRAAGTLLSSPTDMIGSPAYMSPEQARGASEIDGRSDQFALGAITYRMLTGFEPFAGDDIASLLYQVVHEAAQPLARTLPARWDTRALQAVLDRALAKDPAQRYGGMMEMARAFEAASEQTLSHETVERGTINLGATLIAAPPPPPLRPARTPAAATALEAPAATELDDSAPPVRPPPPERLLPTPAQQRAAAPLDFEIDEGATVPRAPRGTVAGWDEPYARDQLPITHHRLALAGVAMLAVAAILGVTGLYRRIVPGVRRELGLARPAPAESHPPTPAATLPSVEAPAVAPAAAPAVTPPAPTPSTPAQPPGPARPPRPAAAEARQEPPVRSHHHHMAPEPRMIERPGSIYLSPSSSPQAPPAARTNPFAQPPRTNPFAQPPPEAPPSAFPPSAFPDNPPPPPDSVPNQFAIPPPAPTEDSPARDLAPPPERGPAAGAAVIPAPVPLPAPAAAPVPAPAPAVAPRQRGPADQPMAPSF
jgi:serine/threonine protein kinase